MNDPAASSGVSSSLLCRHSVLLTESSRVFWIPAFAGMTNSPQAAGNTTLREFNIQKQAVLLAAEDIPFARITELVGHVLHSTAAIRDATAKSVREFRYCQSLASNAKSPHHPPDQRHLARVLALFNDEVYHDPAPRDHSPPRVTVLP